MSSNNQDSPQPEPEDLEAAQITIAQLREALTSRTLIGQATGILMERYDVDAERAFSALSRVSQRTNRKLRDLAADVAATRTFDEDAGPH